MVHITHTKKKKKTQLRPVLKEKKGQKQAEDPMVDSCQCMAKPIQYCKVISLQLKLKSLY